LWIAGRAARVQVKLCIRRRGAGERSEVGGGERDDVIRLALKDQLEEVGYEVLCVRVIPEVLGVASRQLLLEQKSIKGE